MSNTTISLGLLYDTIRVLASCEAKLEYMGVHRVGTHDSPDCLHRAEKARDMISTLRRVIDGVSDDR